MNEFTLRAKGIIIDDYNFDVIADCECTYYSYEEQTWDNPGNEEFTYVVNDFTPKKVRYWNEEVKNWQEMPKDDIPAFKEKVKSVVMQLLEIDLYDEAYEAFIKKTTRERDYENYED